MTREIDYDTLGAALARAGSNWEAAQAHGLICGSLSVAGPDAGNATLARILENCGENNALRAECLGELSLAWEQSHRALTERLSAFEPLLPDDAATGAERTEALAHWCEGYLHGLVSTGEAQSALVKQRLAEDPVADIIKDMLQITRASGEADDLSEESEQAYAELVEYLRVAAQLVYEELAEARHGMNE